MNSLGRGGTQGGRSYNSNKLKRVRNLWKHRKSNGRSRSGRQQ
jgi:hypothetical protein